MFAIKANNQDTLCSSNYDRDSDFNKIKNMIAVLSELNRTNKLTEEEFEIISSYAIGQYIAKDIEKKLNVFLDRVLFEKWSGDNNSCH